MLILFNQNPIQTWKGGHTSWSYGQATEDSSRMCFCLEGYHSASSFDAFVLSANYNDRIFGTQTTPPSPVLKALPKIFGHTDKSVRAEGTLLVRALYQYIGPAIEPWLVDLKPVQVKELKEAFEAMDKEGKGKGSVKPERLTRSQAREAEANQGGGEEEGGDEDTGENLAFLCIF